MAKNRDFMKQLLIFLALVSVLPLQAFDDQKFLDALAQIETGGRDAAVGRSHERSRYQLSHSIWDTYTTIHFRNASRPEMHAVSRSIALKHLKWIKHTLASRAAQGDLAPVSDGSGPPGSPGMIGLRPDRKKVSW